MNIIIETVANVFVIIGAIISVCTYRHSVRKEARLSTMKAYSKIRSKYLDEISKKEIKGYLREMEFFCLGINNKVYDFKTLRRMSGRRLYKQYQNQIKPYIELRRTKDTAKNSWYEYERVMRKLECYYCPNRIRLLKPFCKRR